jgi:hypothetical protein
MNHHAHVEGLHSPQPLHVGTQNHGSRTGFEDRMSE